MLSFVVCVTRIDTFKVFVKVLFPMLSFVDVMCDTKISTLLKRDFFKLFCKFQRFFYHNWTSK